MKKTDFDHDILELIKIIFIFNYNTRIVEQKMKWRKLWNKKI